MKRIWMISLVAVLAVLLSLVLTYLLHRPSNRIIAQWKEPESVNYKSFDPYFLSVVERDIDWSSFPLSRKRRYLIYVGRGSGRPTYGHMIDFSFHPGFDDFDAHVKKSMVEWSDAGVTFKEASGHILFIPKDMFIGGR
jgi:hypothetical protein